MKMPQKQNRKLPVLVEKDEDGFYVAECPLFKGCYSQGKTLDEALSNMREAIALILEEKESQEILRAYEPNEINLTMITV